MRVPTRRGERRRTVDYHVTARKLANMKAELDDIVKRRHPAAAAEVQRTGAFGDFSENAEYKDAKATLRRLLNRMDSLRHRITNAIVIAPPSGDMVALGTTVVLDVDGEEKTYTLVGPQETNPSAGRISHKSPLGQALVGARVGDEIQRKTTRGVTRYRIVSISVQQ